MSVRVMGVANCQKMLRDINVFIESGTPMRKVCEDIVIKIKENTSHGRDYRGSQFASLSENYRIWKQKFGKKGIPDLDLMGDLLAAMAIEIVTPKHGVIFIKQNSQSKPTGGTAKIMTDTLANVHHFGRAAIKMPARPFMAIAEKDVEAAKKKHYDDAIEQIIRSGAGAEFGEPGIR